MVNMRFTREIIELINRCLTGDDDNKQIKKKSKK